MTEDLSTDELSVTRDEAKALIFEIAHNRAQQVDLVVERRVKHRQHDVTDEQIQRWEQEQSDRWRADFPALSAFWRRAAKHFASSSPAVPAGSHHPETVGESTLTDPLIISVGQELAGRVWDPPLPLLPIDQWVGVVEVIAKCVRDCDAEKRWIDRDKRAEVTADAADQGV